MNHATLRLALRARATAVTVCTTGSATLTATTAGYTRTSGSFLTDGFKPGMEVIPTGFTQTAVGVVSSVAALTLTISGGRTAESAGAGRSLRVALPQLVGWDNVPVTPVAGRPFLEEELVPASASLLTLTSRGQVDRDGLYVLRWYGLAGMGPEAIDACTDAVLAAYAPGTGETLSSGETLRIRTTPAPWRSGIVPNPTSETAGFAVCTLTIPYRVSSLNPA
jgi:hypothetical protein